jgi:PhnB protein
VPPADMFWGDRMCSLTDPDGHTWNFATHTGKEFEYKP